MDFNKHLEDITEEGGYVLPSKVAETFGMSPVDLQIRAAVYSFREGVDVIRGRGIAKEHVLPILSTVTEVLREEDKAPLDGHLAGEVIDVGDVAEKDVPKVNGKRKSNGGGVLKLRTDGVFHGADFDDEDEEDEDREEEDYEEGGDDEVAKPRDGLSDVELAIEERKAREKSDPERLERERLAYERRLEELRQKRFRLSSSQVSGRENIPKKVKQLPKNFDPVNDFLSYCSNLKGEPYSEIIPEDYVPLQDQVSPRSIDRVTSVPSLESFLREVMGPKGWNLDINILIKWVMDSVGASRVSQVKIGSTLEERMASELFVAPEIVKDVFDSVREHSALELTRENFGELKIGYIASGGREYYSLPSLQKVVRKILSESISIADHLSLARGVVYVKSFVKKLIGVSLSEHEVRDFVLEELPRYGYITRTTKFRTKDKLKEDLKDVDFKTPIEEGMFYRREHLALACYYFLNAHYGVEIEGLDGLELETRYNKVKDLRFRRLGNANVATSRMVESKDGKAIPKKKSNEIVGVDVLSLLSEYGADTSMMFASDLSAGSVDDFLRKASLKGMEFRGHSVEAVAREIYNRKRGFVSLKDFESVLRNYPSAKPTRKIDFRSFDIRRLFSVNKVAGMFNKGGVDELDFDFLSRIYLSLQDSAKKKRFFLVKEGKLCFAPTEFGNFQDLSIVQYWGEDYLRVLGVGREIEVEYEFAEKAQAGKGAEGPKKPEIIHTYGMKWSPEKDVDFKEPLGVYNALSSLGAPWLNCIYDGLVLAGKQVK